MCSGSSAADSTSPPPTTSCASTSPGGARWRHRPGATRLGAPRPAGASPRRDGPGDVTPLERVAYRDVWPGVTVVYTGAGSGAILKSSYASPPAIRRLRPGASSLAVQPRREHRRVRRARGRLRGRRAARVGAGGLADHRRRAPAGPGALPAAGGAPSRLRRRRLRPPLPAGHRPLAHLGRLLRRRQRRLLALHRPRRPSGDLYVVGDSTASWQGSAAPVNAYADKTGRLRRQAEQQRRPAVEHLPRRDRRRHRQRHRPRRERQHLRDRHQRRHLGHPRKRLLPAAPTPGSRSSIRRPACAPGTPSSAAPTGTRASPWPWAAATSTWAAGATLPGARRSTPHDGDNDYCAFVAKLDTSGALQWNTFLGPNGTEREPGHAAVHLARGRREQRLRVRRLRGDVEPGRELGRADTGRAYTSGLRRLRGEARLRRSRRLVHLPRRRGDDLAFGITAPDARQPLRLRQQHRQLELARALPHRSWRTRPARSTTAFSSS